MEWYQIVDKARSLIDEIDAKLNREQKQTQEPESVEPAEWKCPFCGHKECWFDRTTDENGYMGFRCDKCGRRDDEKEPECEHDYGKGIFSEHKSPKCLKCGKHWLEEKPAKKECEPSLALRLMRVMYSTPEAMLTSDRIESVADEARKWAVEVIEQMGKEPHESSMPTYYYVEEIKRRLKEGGNR